MQEREQLALADRDPAALVIDAAMGRELVEHLCERQEAG